MAASLNYTSIRAVIYIVYLLSLAQVTWKEKRTNRLT
jgi:hypothetical protein